MEFAKPYILLELFKELFAVLFVHDGKDDGLWGMDSVINSKITASQTIKRRIKVCQSFYPGFTDGKGRCFQISFNINCELEGFINLQPFNILLS